MDRSIRSRAARALGRYFERRRWPRLSLGLVVLLTGTAGFALSTGLLRLGLAEMWLRYPLVVAGAYLIFLGLLRIWVEIERHHFDVEDPEVLAALEGAEDEAKPSGTSERRSWFDWLDVPDFGGIDSLEGCAVGILVAAVLGLLIVAVTLVAGAPVLVAEAAVDTFIVAVLYRRLKTAEREHWLGAAVRKTWLHALITAALLSVIGVSLEMLVPDAHSVGESIGRYFEK